MNRNLLYSLNRQATRPRGSTDALPARSVRRGSATAGTAENRLRIEERFLRIVIDSVSGSQQVLAKPRPRICRDHVAVYQADDVRSQASL
jgi:hypothetical protein